MEDVVSRTLWGLHNDHPELGLLENGFVSVGWDEVGDLGRLDATRDAFKAALIEEIPDYKPGAVPVAPSSR